MLKTKKTEKVFIYLRPMEVRARILEESGQLFGKYGIRSMTMDALAEELGISKRTIYERFPDKDTLLLEVFKHFKQQTADEVDRLIDQSDNAIEALFRIIRMTVSQMIRVNPAFFHDLKKYHPGVLKQMTHPGGAIRDFSMTERLLNKGIEQGVFRDDFHVDIVNLTLHSLFELFGHNSTLVDAGYHRKDLFKHTLLPYLRGISTEKGHELLHSSESLLEEPMV